MTIFTTGGRIGISALTAINTVAECPLGTVVGFYDDVAATNGEAVYARAGAAITEGQAGLIDLANKVTLASNGNANSGKPIGFALSSTAMADGDYGWFAISGKVKVKTPNAVVADAKVFLLATAGAVDDAVLAGCQLLGAEFANADGTPAAGFAYANINRPTVQSQIT